MPFYKRLTQNKLFTISLSVLVVIVSLVSFLTIGTKAAEYYPKNSDNTENIEIKGSKDTVYAAGQNINVKEIIAKDLVVAGQDIKVTANVNRSIMVAGQNIDIKSARVAGATRVAGQKITLSGTFYEEVIIAGEEVDIKDAQILGDLIVATNKLTVNNIAVGGNAYGSYKELNGEFKSKVRGDYKVEKAQQTNLDQSWFIAFIAVQLSVILALLILAYFLNRKGKLWISGITLNFKEFSLNTLFGFALLVLPIPVLILSFILQLYPLVLALSALIYLSLILISFYFPIYLANLVHNTFNLKNKFVYTIIASYLLVVILSSIPYISGLFGFIFFIILLSNFGYLAKKLSSMVVGTNVTAPKNDQLINLPSEVVSVTKVTSDEPKVEENTPEEESKNLDGDK